MPDLAGVGSWGSLDRRSVLLEVGGRAAGTTRTTRLWKGSWAAFPGAGTRCSRSRVLLPPPALGSQPWASASLAQIVARAVCRQLRGRKAYPTASPLRLPGEGDLPVSGFPFRG